LEELRPTLERHLRTLCRDESEVDDVVQETLLRAARYRGSQVRSGRLVAWALGIARNVFRDLRRRESRLRRLELDGDGFDSLEGREPTPGALPPELVVRVRGRSVEEHVVERQFPHAMDDLRVADRRLLDAYYASGSRAALAACGASAELVKVRLFRARRRLLRSLVKRLALANWPSTALALLALLALACRPNEREPRSATDSAEWALRDASRLKGEMYALEHAEREPALERAVAAYRDIAEREDLDRVQRALSALRAGSLLRAAGRMACAADEFRRAERLGDAELRARARLELGHLARRAGDARSAAREYEGVLRQIEAPARLRADASFWLARVEHDRGRVEDAREAWRRALASDVDPLDRLRALDELALSHIDRGEADAARAVLRDGLCSLAASAREASSTGARLRAAIERMRSVRALMPASSASGANP
jgi:RNA polymerase sigma factor (sigma-70 family)